LSLKDASIETIKRFAPNAMMGPKWPGTTKGTIAHLLPPRDSVDRASETGEPAWLMFPAYDANLRAELRPVSKGRALIRAADNGFNYSVLGRLGFETLADLIDRCECYDLRYGDLDAAIKLLDAL
jgi:HprK-related kinase A